MIEFDFRNAPGLRVHDCSWNHPDLADVVPLNCDASCKEILDRDKSLEERLEAQQRYNQINMAVFGDLPEEVAALVNVREVHFPGLHEDDPDVRALVIAPRQAPQHKVPCVLYFHGGGMVMNSPELNKLDEAQIALALGCVVIAPAYRLLPMWTYPAAVDDAEATVNYLISHAEELNISIDRVVAYGCSAGGYMAACISQRVKQRDDFRFAGEMLIHPVIDDTFAFESDKLFYGEIWHPSDDQLMFNALLGPDYYRGAAPEDAVPIHCTDFDGIPPTVLYTGDLDYGHDACMKYCQGIMNAGIFCDLHVWGGCFHTAYAFGFGTDLFNRTTASIIEDLKLLCSGSLIRK